MPLNKRFPGIRHRVHARLLYLRLSPFPSIHSRIIEFSALPSVALRVYPWLTSLRFYPFGSITVNVVPFPSLLFTSILPPWERTILCTSGKTKPHALVLGREERKKYFLNRFFRNARRRYRDHDNLTFFPFASLRSKGFRLRAWLRPRSGTGWRKPAASALHQRTLRDRPR